jgi:hypothetical protein
MASFSPCPSKPDPQHLQRLYYHLQQVDPAGTFTKPIHYKELFAGTGRKELLVFITDMYQADGEINALLNSLSALKHEIIVFHLMGQNELDFDFKGFSTLEDLETGETIQVNTQRAKDTYNEKATGAFGSYKKQPHGQAHRISNGEHLAAVR